MIEKNNVVTKQVSSLKSQIYDNNSEILKFVFTSLLMRKMFTLFEVSSFPARLFPIDNIVMEVAQPFFANADVVLRRWFLMSFNFENECSCQSSEQRVTVEPFRRWLTSLTASDKSLSEMTTVLRGPVFRLPGPLSFFGCPSDCWAPHFARALQIVEVLSDCWSPSDCLGPTDCWGPSDWWGFADCWARAFQNAEGPSYCYGPSDCWRTTDFWEPLKIAGPSQIAGSSSDCWGHSNFWKPLKIAGAPQIDGAP